MPLAHHRERLGAVAAFADFVALRAQCVAEAESDMGVVFHDKDVFFHVEWKLPGMSVASILAQFL